MPDVYVDADACSVKHEVARVAERHKMTVYLVSNSGTRQNFGPHVKGILVSNAFDAADDWIAAEVKPRDLVITADILLAARCLEQGALVLGPTGKIFSADNIGTALAMRELNAHLRETSEITGHNPPFSARDRSQFLQAMEEIIQRIKRLA